MYKRQTFLCGYDVKRKTVLEVRYEGPIDIRQNLPEGAPFRPAAFKSSWQQMSWGKAEVFQYTRTGEGSGGDSPK